MQILMISWDSTAAMDKKRHKMPGNLHARLIEYGKQVSKLYVIAPSPKKMKLGAKRLGVNVFVYPTSFGRFPFLCEGFKIAVNILKRNKVNIITTQDPYLCGLLGYLLKKLFDIPLIVQIHGDNLDNRFWLSEKKTNYLLNFLGKLISSKADAIRVVNTKIKNYFINDLKFPAERLYLIPICVDVEEFRKRDLDTNLRRKYSEYENTVLYVGRLSKEKNLQTLLKSAPLVLKEFPKTMFLIVGDGPEREKLEWLVKEMSLSKNVIFEGSVDHAQIHNYYSMCDLFALTSNHESMGMVLLEALACGKPVISTDVSGARDFLVNGETGFIVPINDYKKLAEKIVELLKDSEKRICMGLVGYERATKFQSMRDTAIKFREMCYDVVRRV